MPHSSGGGSHSGGSHSSSSSSSSSHSSSGGGGSSIRITDHYFAGATKYVKYTENGPDYIYSSSKELNKPASKLRFIVILFYMPFFIGLFIFASSVIKIPRRLPLKYNTEIIIEDNLDVVEDEVKLKQKLEDFLDDTGISIALITDTNDAWKNDYNNMETYAYDMYVCRFFDESHWLIVYSSDQNEDFDDWYFEGMQGDDTDDILTTHITSIFNDSMTKYLMQGYSVDRSMIKAIADIKANGLMKIHADPISIIVILIFSLFLIAHLGLMLSDPNKKYRDYMVCDSRMSEEQCEYCGTPYWPGTIFECPNCGAPLKIPNFKGREEED